MPLFPPTPALTKRETVGHYFHIKFSFYALCEKERINKSPHPLSTFP
jgi:hypothetical protein